MTVYGYLRVSTDEQGRSGLGLSAQRAAIDEEATRRGWLVDYVTDEGVSGSIPGSARPSLGPVLASVGRGDVLVTAKLDRLGRSALDVLGLADRAERDGWSLVVLDLGLDTTTPVGRFTLTALAGVAQLERDLISARTRDALQAARRRGTRLGRPVVAQPELRSRIAKDRESGMSLREIAAGLMDDGVPTPQGGATWHASSVQSVLRSLRVDEEYRSSVPAS